MDFEIDVSGEDIFSKDYTIVVADKKSLIRGFKFNRELIRILRSRQGEGRYRYPLSKLGRALFRIRVYCIIVHYLFRSINFKRKSKEVNLDICRDFEGHEKDITSNLKYFLGTKLGLKINARYFKLPRGANADRYAYLMRRDTKNKMKGYVRISLSDIERYLQKK